MLPDVTHASYNMLQPVTISYYMLLCVTACFRRLLRYSTLLQVATWYMLLQVNITTCYHTLLHATTLYKVALTPRRATSHRNELHFCLLWVSLWEAPVCFSSHDCCGNFKLTVVFSGVPMSPVCLADSLLCFRY
jgi:hypothetical protein